MKNTTWKKFGDWRSVTSEGPRYYHESGRAMICGSWGTLGDNMRGWRKSKCYSLTVDGVEVTRARSHLKIVQKLAEKHLELS